MASPLKIGLIGLDTSHVSAFTKTFNIPATPYHIPGAKVVAAYPGGSKDFELSISRVEGFTKELRDQYGVAILSSPEAVAEAVDLLFIEAVDGRTHLDYFRHTVKHKRPTFIDKPLAVASADARAIAQLARQNGVSVMTSSSLRYADNLAAELARPAAADLAVTGCDASGPIALQPTQPGLFWYGIHTVEVIYTVMGPGCREVRAVPSPDYELVVGLWNDGRVATIRGDHKGQSPFRVTIHRGKECVHLDLYANARPMHAAMLEDIMRHLPQGKTPFPLSTSVEIVRFIEAANESRATDKPVTL